MSDILVAVALVVVGLALLAFGVAAYRGRGRQAVTTFWFPTAHFATAWLGVGVLAGGIGRTLLVLAPQGETPPALRVVYGLLLLVGGVAWLVGLVGLFWLPAALTPLWFRLWQARGSDPREFASPEHLTRLDRLWSASIRRSYEREARRRDR